MFFFGRTLERTMTFNSENNITIQELREMIRLEEGLTSDHEIIIARGNTTLQDEDKLMVKQEDGVTEFPPYVSLRGSNRFFASGKQEQHLSGHGFDIMIKSPDSTKSATSCSL